MGWPKGKPRGPRKPKLESNDVAPQIKRYQEAVDTSNRAEDEFGLPFWTRHRGPYRLHATRNHPTKTGYFKSEWLQGEIRNGQDVHEEALALLGDPRDFIISIFIWSVTEEQWVGAYRYDSI